MKGCGNHGCKIAKPDGMGTNGPCACWQRVQPLDEKVTTLRKALLQITAIIETQSEPDIDAIHDVAREALNK